ncbi:MAG TPA: transporter substrate-binding domain-containing protein [Bacillales bacterium]|jgi:putative glutamine transport system substrate-binding protein|nr:transporter substrate-binding domain-containing protein [Bacillales bacterium]
MRKTILFLFMLVFTFSFALAGCGSSGGSNTAGGDEAKSTLQKIKDRGKLIAGVKYDVKLFGLKDPASGKIKGYDADLMRALAKHIFGEDKNIEDILEFKQVNSKTRFEMVNNGEVDMASATATVTPDREKKVDFSNIYFIAGQSLLVKKGSPIKSIDDLGPDTTVIAVKGSTSEKNIKEKAPDAPVQLFDDYAQAFSALKAGKGVTLTTDNAILLGMHKEDPNYVLTGGLFTDEPYGMIFRENDDRFRKYVNDFLNQMKESGKLAEIYKKWFGDAPPDDILKENTMLK